MKATALLISAVLLVAVDQWMKAFVISWLPHGRAAAFGPVRIRTVLNQRVHGGSVRGARMMLVLWLVEAAIFAALVHLGPFFQGLLALVALGAALGGATSNLFDCLWRDGVVDFVDLGFWPLFNLADVAIVAGIFTVVLCV